MRIRDVISPTLGVRFEELSSVTLEKMRAMGIAHVIVTQANAICGVVSERDLAYACRLNPDGPVGELATNVPVVESEAPITEAAQVMRANKVACVPVVENAAIAGVVTIENLLDLIREGTVKAMRRAR